MEKTIKYGILLCIVYVTSTSIIDFYKMPIDRLQVLLSLLSIIAYVSLEGFIFFRDNKKNNKYNKKVLFKFLIKCTIVNVIFGMLLISIVKISNNISINYWITIIIIGVVLILYFKFIDYMIYGKNKQKYKKVLK